MLQNAFLNRMPSGVPGSVTRQEQATAESCIMGDNPPLQGCFGKLDAAGNFTALAAGDTLYQVYGVLIRGFPRQGYVTDITGANLVMVGKTHDVLRRGYIAVKLNAGASIKGQPVFVRIANDTPDKPLGGIEALDDGSNTLQLNATFMGSADANGTVEIAYNI